MEFKDDVAREVYRKGIWVLKERIKDLAAEQTRAKKCLRVIRKRTKPEVEKLAALKAGGYEGDDRPKHWECEKRRQQITAYLTIYAKVRGEENCNPIRQSDSLYQYQRDLEEAQAVFDAAVKISTTA